MSQIEEIHNWIGKSFKVHPDFVKKGINLQILGANSCDTN